ncbi:hypothetical protein JCM19297_2827 [Nonlabens ulvanivorans]|nr:hypothetical protein JCM19297_2827 [Nonlabens ulvanivorans]
MGKDLFSIILTHKELVVVERVFLYNPIKVIITLSRKRN